MEELLIITSGIAILAEVIKRFVKPKFGEMGVKGVVILISLGVAILKFGLDTQTLIALGEYVVLANGIYQVVGKWILGDAYNRVTGGKIEVKVA